MHSTCTRPKCSIVLCFCPDQTCPKTNIPNSISHSLIPQKICTLQNSQHFHHNTKHYRMFYLGYNKSTDTSPPLPPPKAQIPMFKAQLQGPALQLTPQSEGNGWKLLSPSHMLEFWRAVRDQTQPHTQYLLQASHLASSGFFRSHSEAASQLTPHCTRVLVYLQPGTNSQTRRLLFGSKPLSNKIFMHDPISFCHCAWSVKHSICSYTVPKAVCVVLLKQ